MRITRERFWVLLEQARLDARTAASAMTPDELIGFQQWQTHFGSALLRRPSIGALARLCLDPWPEHDDQQLKGFVYYLFQQGERLIEAAVRDPDTIADVPWDGPPAASVDAVRIVFEIADARGFPLRQEDLLPPPSWPGDVVASEHELVKPPLLQRFLPRLVARLQIESLQNTMPRAPWQLEAQARNPWWALAWDALEVGAYACEPPRFWRQVEMIGWPERKDIAPFKRYGMPARIRFALRFHERFTALERAVAAYEPSHGSLGLRDRREALAGVIAAGRATYDTTLADPGVLREPFLHELGFGQFVDELRRAPPGNLLSLLPTELSDRANELPVGAIVIDYAHGYGFVAARSPGARPDHIVYFDTTVPIEGS